MRTTSHHNSVHTWTINRNDIGGNSQDDSFCISCNLTLSSDVNMSLSLKEFVTFTYNFCDGCWMSTATSSVSWSYSHMARQCFCHGTPKEIVSLWNFFWTKCPRKSNVQKAFDFEISQAITSVHKLCRLVGCVGSSLRADVH